MVSDGGQLDLEAIKTRERSATEGPWAIWRDLDHQGFITVGDEAGVIPDGAHETDGECNPTAHVYTEWDATFIAAARADVAALLAEVERLRNEAKALRNDDDYDPAPIVTEYDRVVEENERLRRENVDLVRRLGYDPNRPLADWEQRFLDDEARHAAAERDVIEAAKAWRANFKSPFRSVVENDLALGAAVDVLSQPAEEAS